MDHAPRHRSDYYWLAAILLLALTLRIVGLNGPLWYDEILTVDRHLRLPWGDMLDGYSMNNHYLFNLQSKLAMVMFGEQNWAVRLPALAFGVAAVGAMWWLARDVAGTTIAHVTALLLALSYHHIWFSQNARGYSELAFFSTLGMILYLRGMARPTARIWAAYGITLALAVFTHLTGAFLFAAQGVFWLVLVLMNAAKGQLQPGQIKWPFIGFVIGAGVTILLYAPLLPSLFSTLGQVSGTSAIDVMQEYQNPLWSLLEGVRTALGSTGTLVGLVAILVLALSLIGTIAAAKTSPLFAPLVWAHIILTLLLLTVLGMRIWPRFFFADIGFVMLLIVLGVKAVTGWLDRITGRVIPYPFAIAAIAMVCVSAALATRNYTAPKQDIAGAYAYVESIRTPEDRVFTAGQANRVFVGHFNADWGEITTDADYAAAKATPGPMLIVVAFPARSLRAIPMLDAGTETELQLEKRFAGTLGDGAVLIFRREQ